jgi:uncharacterized membrane protein HdeD (DUF308 family)
MGCTEGGRQTSLSRMRWAVGLRGLIFALFGALLLSWPRLTVEGFRGLFLACAAARGLIGLAASIGRPGTGERRWMAMMSLPGITAAVVLLLGWSTMSGRDLLYFFGGYALALGVLALGGAFLVPTEGRESALIVLSGLISLAFGIVVFARPGSGVLMALAVVAAFALVLGMTEVTLAAGGRGLVAARISRMLGAGRRLQT